MKTLLFFPLFSFALLVAPARACDSSEVAGAAASGPAAGGAPTSRADADAAKKNSGTPPTARPAAPKRDRAAVPACLFME